ncbi:MAG TPA: anthranilate phosphoribosyltransferase [Thermoleophilaceae bacterium]|nr:anthranilate phosphoribosyltransferase [Thermoleophilaceae bacterium]
MPNQIVTTALDRVASGADLDAAEAAAVLREVMEGKASEVETAGFLAALRTKGESVEEVVGLARTMRELARGVEVGNADLLDTAGTGGGRPTYNVSTTAAFVAAGAGCAVAKHGNRSATGTSGSADVLESLGARIDLEPEAVAECIHSVGFGFMFAPQHHGAMRYVVPVRKALGVRTVFNFLGPLTNPAGATRQLIGVSDGAHLGTIAAALGELGGRTALVVSSEDGLDEISASGPTRAVELRDGGTRELTLRPEDCGMDPAPADALRAGRPEENAAITRAVLEGRGGPERSVAVINAGAALYVAGRAESIREGVGLAEQAIDSGAAAATLARFVERTRELAPR